VLASIITGLIAQPSHVARLSAWQVRRRRVRRRTSSRSGHATMAFAQPGSPGVWETIEIERPRTRQRSGSRSGEIANSATEAPSARESQIVSCGSVQASRAVVHQPRFMAWHINHSAASAWRFHSPVDDVHSVRSLASTIEPRRHTIRCHGTSLSGPLRRSRVARLPVPKAR
jgi:hypothetical protein